MSSLSGARVRVGEGRVKKKRTNTNLHSSSRSSPFRPPACPGPRDYLRFLMRCTSEEASQSSCSLGSRVALKVLQLISYDC